MCRKKSRCLPEAIDVIDLILTFCENYYNMHRKNTSVRNIYICSKQF